MKWVLLLIGICLILTACRSQSTAVSANESERFFPETGYTVRGKFLNFYLRYGGVESLGYPLSEEMKSEGWQVQYFEKGRLEYHPENEPAYQVTVGWLGELLQRRRPPIHPSAIPRANTSSHRYYPETGHTVSGDFMHYFDLHGGTVRFGRPISEPFLLEGQLVQDFQSARFFWTPEISGAVTLEDIGQVHLKQIREKP